MNLGMLGVLRPRASAGDLPRRRTKPCTCQPRRTDADLIGISSQPIAEHPGCELTMAQLIVALQGCGVEAGKPLSTSPTRADHLADEISVEPGPRWVSSATILASDPDLSPVPAIVGQIDQSTRRPRGSPARRQADGYLRATSTWPTAPGRRRGVPSRPGTTAHIMRPSSWQERHAWQDRHLPRCRRCGKGHLSLARSAVRISDPTARPGRS